MDKEIIVMALQSEAPEMADWPNVFFTGVGKVNAAIRLTELLSKFPDIDKVWNFGTAGGITVESGFYKCTKFLQRDMKCEPMGYVRGQTPYEPSCLIITGDDGLICSSGDDFVTDPAEALNSNIVDMEAYSFAKVCNYFGVEFECWKYISDAADENSPDAWKENQHKGEQLYINKYNDRDF